MKNNRRAVMAEQIEQYLRQLGRPAQKRQEPNLFAGYGTGVAAHVAAGAGCAFACRGFAPAGMADGFEE